MPIPAQFEFSARLKCPHCGQAVGCLEVTQALGPVGEAQIMNGTGNLIPLMRDHIRLEHPAL